MRSFFPNWFSFIDFEYYDQISFLKLIKGFYWQVFSTCGIFYSHICLFNYAIQIQLIIFKDELNLSYNELEDFSCKHDGFKTLRTLNLTRNKLTFIPQPIFHFVKLETLKLSKNQLSSLPHPDTWKNKRLADLDLSSNQVWTIFYNQKLSGELDENHVIIMGKTIKKKWNVTST